MSHQQQIQPSRSKPTRQGLFSSLKTRLRWSYALATVIPLVLLGSLLITTNILTQRRNVAAGQQTAADWVAREIRTYLSGVDDQLLRLGERARPDQPRAELLDEVFTLRQNRPEFVDLALMDGRGREL